MAQIRLLAALVLVVLAGVQIAYVLSWAPLVGGALWADASKLSVVAGARGALGLAMVLALGWSVALLTTLAAAGIGTGHRIGWWLGVTASAAWLLTGCAPLALVALGVLMLPDVREQAFPPPTEGG
jgi:hypothetical protein